MGRYQCGAEIKVHRTDVNTRNINMNGNFVRAAETERQGGDYRKLLGITDSTDKVYTAYLSRLYKLYKERIQF